MYAAMHPAMDGPEVWAAPEMKISGSDDSGRTHTSQSELASGTSCAACA